MLAYFRLLGNIPLSMQLFISEDKMVVNMSALSALGKGIKRQVVSDDVSFPQNFIHSRVNKNDLGLFLASKLVSIHHDVGTPHLQVCVTYNDTIISLRQMGPSVFEIKTNSEVADQKIVPHALHCITSHHNDTETDISLTLKFNQSIMMS